MCVANQEWSARSHMSLLQIRSHMSNQQTYDSWFATNQQSYVCCFATHGHKTSMRSHGHKTCRVSHTYHVQELKHMGWLPSVWSIKLYVSFAKETYKRDNIYVSCLAHVSCSCSGVMFIVFRSHVFGKSGDRFFLWEIFSVAKCLLQPVPWKLRLRMVIGMQIEILIGIMKLLF